MTPTQVLQSLLKNYKLNASRPRIVVFYMENTVALQISVRTYRLYLASANTKRKKIRPYALGKKELDGLIEKNKGL